MVLTLPLAAALAVSLAPAQESSVVVGETRLDATTHAWQRAVGGGWCAWVESLPATPRQLASAARFVPWQVVRRAAGGEAEVVLRWDDAHDWPSRVRPAHVACGADGALVATDRWGSRILVAPPAGAPPRVLALPHEPEGEVVRLEPEGILSGSRDRREDRALTWRSLDAPGPGRAAPSPPLVAPRSGAQARVVRSGRELVWCSAKDSLTALDVETGELRTLPFPEAAAFTLERAAGGRLFSRALGQSDVCFHGELRLTNLATGASMSRPAPRALAAWLPQGLFVPYAFHDPLDRRHVGLAESVWVHGMFVPIDAVTVAFRAGRDDDWRLLHLDEIGAFAPPPPGAAEAAVVASLEHGAALGSTEFMHAVDAVPVARSGATIDLLARVLRSDAGVNAKMRAASRLALGSDPRARAPLRDALVSEGSFTLRLQAALGLASFMQADDARAIEAAFPVESLPGGTRHGDAAAQVAEALAIIGDEASVPYLEALLERAPLDGVRRALESVRSAPRFRTELVAARGL